MKTAKLLKYNWKQVCTDGVRRKVHYWIIYSKPVNYDSIKTEEELKLITHIGNAIAAFHLREEFDIEIKEDTEANLDIHFNSCVPPLYMMRNCDNLQLNFLNHSVFLATKIYFTDYDRIDIRNQIFESIHLSMEVYHNIKKLDIVFIEFPFLRKTPI